MTPLAPALDAAPPATSASRTPAVPAHHSEPDPLHAPRSALAQRLLAHMPGEGLRDDCGVEGLALIRANAAASGICGMYEPCMALVLQGAKQVVMGEQTLHYGPQRYFITSLNLPAVSTILDASPERPYLALALRLDLRELSGLLLAGLNVPPPPPGLTDRRAMTTGAVDAPLLDAFARLVELVDRPAADREVLAPLVRREVFYRLLTGEAGWRLRQIAVLEGQGHPVVRAIDLLRQRYTEPLRIDDLAREARVGSSTLHHQFKNLTGMSPLQYQKQLRLNEARRLMLGEHLDAAAAAYRVGYESASQFSREYSRLFGAPPGRDIARLRQATGAEAQD